MTSNIEPLARDWLTAKKDEADARERRIATEERLIQAFCFSKPEGAETVRAGGYKVTFCRPVCRKLDERAWMDVKQCCPPNMWPVKVKTEADAAGCKYLANNEPEIWAQIAAAFTTKPGKVSVKIEKTKEAE